MTDETAEKPETPSDEQEYVSPIDQVLDDTPDAIVIPERFQSMSTEDFRQLENAARIEQSTGGGGEFFESIMEGAATFFGAMAAGLIKGAKP